MGALSGWCGGLARLAAALALTLLVLSPSLDAVFCRDGGTAQPTPATAEAVQMVSTTADAEPGKAAPCPCGGICLHGHCYHAAPGLPPAPLDSGPRPVSSGERHALADPGVPTASPHFELMRPPRA